MIRVTVELLTLLLQLREILKRIVPADAFDRRTLLSLMLRLDQFRDNALSVFLSRQVEPGVDYKRAGGWSVPPHGDEFITFDVSSSLARRLLYNFVTRELRIVFTSGKVHSYLNVPHKTFFQVLYGDGYSGSVGAAYNALIRGNQDYSPAAVEGDEQIGERRPERLFTVVVRATRLVPGAGFAARELVAVPVMATSRRQAEGRADSLLEQAGFDSMITHQVAEGAAVLFNGNLLSLAQ